MYLYCFFVHFTDYYDTPFNTAVALAHYFKNAALRSSLYVYCLCDGLMILLLYSRRNALPKPTLKLP
jgi:hypothetical protein